MTSSAVLAIDQGTANSKAALTRSDGRTLAVGAGPVGVSAPRLGWIEQDAELIWSSVRDAVAKCRCGEPDAEIRGVALSTQRESVVAWRAGTGRAVGPVIWATLGERSSWPAGDGGKVYEPMLPEPDRRRRRQWAGEIGRSRYQDGTR